MTRYEEITAHVGKRQASEGDITWLVKAVRILLFDHVSCPPDRAEKCDCGDVDCNKCLLTWLDREVNDEI